MSADRDYYRILHVDPDAPTAIIHASYRTLMQRLKQHPDLGGDHEHAVLLNEAYAALSDPDRRAAYDLRRDIAESQRVRVPNVDPGATLEETGELFAGARCIFCGTPHGLQRALERDDECGECRSPLCPAERRRLEYSGQRMIRRMRKRQAMKFYAGWPQAEPFAAELRDLSLNGMQFVAAQALRSNQIIKIDSDVCQAIARVAHCERSDTPERWTIGVEFLTLRFLHDRGSFVSARA